MVNLWPDPTHPESDGDRFTLEARGADADLWGSVFRWGQRVETMTLLAGITGQVTA